MSIRIHVAMRSALSQAAYTVRFLCTALRCADQNTKCFLVFRSRAMSIGFYIKHTTVRL